MLVTLIADFDNFDNPIEVPVSKISVATIMIVKEWMLAHKEDGDMFKNETTSEWDSTLTESERAFFHKLSENELYELISAANFLDMPHLLDKACELVAGMVRGRSSEEIAQIFGLNSLAAAKRNTVDVENQWLGD
ncbi:unnamed protein product [Bursaphelenchus okinawaensis]|uniref:Skp1-related protein n=1 Tax=Bursaphelenchus okinawaensis TaxID=465554 RepID=A0A811KB13_9BILA|nr:unnamed protein product [Bursaphelenchus okinawaensis]CAG9100612.1 unnamed protein product [Bursaphelenchus okinawaensis]